MHEYTEQYLFTTILMTFFNVEIKIFESGRICGKKKKKTNSENSSSKIFSVMYKIMHNYN